MEEKKTAIQWFEELDEPRGVILYDPDGFDRQNWIYSWTQELLTKKEYNSKMMMCTIMVIPKEPNVK